MNNILSIYELSSINYNFSTHLQSVNNALTGISDQGFEK